ncbi:FecR domain-containing protein [Adhaeretor mobilis]|uniref:FecR protein n=1 Tax=Adhaeretor mobilis TaxID=1930276 RepID=A0A517MYJ2_9BACT|nr:FecR domain-containing protein [Adhaeretor mobilis]QDS99944.1 FecR protein [Adhaeretor mobilis]
MTDHRSELHDRIHELVTCQLEEDAQGANAQALHKLVTGDAEARRVYMQYMQESYRIASRLAPPTHDATLDGIPPDSSQPATKHSGERYSLKGLLFPGKQLLFLATAAMLLLSGLFWYGQVHDSDTTDGIAHTVQGGQNILHAVRDSSATEVATLVHGADIVCDATSGDLSDLTRLKIGQELRLLEGSAEIVFDSGVEAIAIAPCQMTIQGAGEISTKYGRITARVGERGKGFVIETSVARVTDLGTAFGVEVEETGETSIAVFEGEVDLEYGSPTGKAGVPLRAKKNRLTQGEGLRIDQFGMSSRLFSIDSIKLPQVRQLPPVNIQHSVVSTVYDNISEERLEMRNYYHIVRSGLREDSQAFVDRLHQWNGIDATGIPKDLIGADYVMPFNEDKFIADLEVVLTLERPATVYLFLSDDEVVPEWISKDYVDTGRDIGLDEGVNPYRMDLALDDGPGKSIDTLFSIWKREVVSPLSITLGPVKKPKKRVMRNGVSILPGYNMYGIAAVAL